MTKQLAALALATLLAGPALAVPEVGDTVPNADEVSNVVLVEESNTYHGPQVMYPYWGYYRFDLHHNEQLRVKVNAEDSSRYHLILYRARGEGDWDRIVAESDTDTLEYNARHSPGIYYLRMVPNVGVGGPFWLNYWVVDPD